MNNPDLVSDYVTRCRSRLKALELLYREKNYADVMREAQELVELALKAVLRASDIDPPRIHDVSEALLENEERLPAVFRKNLKKVAKISHALRRDRELAFYGTEDLTPSKFYTEEDASEALEQARWILELVLEAKLS